MQQNNPPYPPLGFFLLSFYFKQFLAMVNFITMGFTTRLENQHFLISKQPTSQSPPQVEEVGSVESSRGIFSSFRAGVVICF